MWKGIGVRGRKWCGRGYRHEKEEGVRREWGCEREELVPKSLECRSNIVDAYQLHTLQILANCSYIKISPSTQK